MPPRYIYWTIIYGSQATSFRASTRDELLPTLKQLQSRHPDAVLKFFARGKLWDSEEDARQWRDERKRPERRPEARQPSPDNRGRDWRPGGTHRDPRDRYKVPRDVKRKRFADRLRRDHVSPKPTKPAGDTGGPASHPPKDAWRRDRRPFQTTPGRDDRNRRPPDKDALKNQPPTPRGARPRGPASTSGANSSKRSDPRQRSGPQGRNGPQGPRRPPKK